MTCDSVSPSTLQVKRLSDKASIPVRGSAYAAGYDLMRYLQFIFSAEEKIVPAKSKAVIFTDISISVPIGTYGRIAPRSGLASKNFIDVGAGVIDCDYRGNVGVLLFNFSDTDFSVKQGDRIAQLIIEKIEMLPVEEVETLEATVRGENGFGSTGIKRMKESNQTSSQ